MKNWKDHLGGLKEILVYAYIWQIPFSWRYIFEPSRSSWNSGFNEYMDLSLYIGEVLILFALLTHILEYIIKEKSIYNDGYRKSHDLFHVEHLLSFKTIILSVGALLSINVILSIDRMLSLVFFGHCFLLFIFGYLFVRIFVSRGTNFLKIVFYILFISLVVQSVISFFQVSQNMSVGLEFLNESVLSVDSINVAKSNLFSNTNLRAYGTFPHPNVLSAYALLVVIYLFSILRSKLFHVEQYLIYSTVGFSALLMLLTQSKLNTILFLIVIFYCLNEKYRLFHVKQLVSILLFSVTFFLFSTILLNSDAKTSFDTRITQYQNQSIDSDYVFFGSGIGTYRLSYDKSAVDWWNYEPIHFVPMILFRELGLLLSTILVILLIKFLKDVPRETIVRNILSGTFIVFILLSDHYSWDIYQGSFILTMGLLVIIIDKYNNKLYNSNSKV